MEKELKRVSVVPMRGMVLFPHMTLNFDAAREMSIKALESAAENDSIVFLAAQKDYTIEQPTVDDIYSIGTFAVIKQVMRMPGGITRVIVKGLERGIIENFISETSLNRSRRAFCFVVRAWAPRLTHSISVRRKFLRFLSAAAANSSLSAFASKNPL